MVTTNEMETKRKKTFYLLAHYHNECTMNNKHTLAQGQVVEVNGRLCKGNLKLSHQIKPSDSDIMINSSCFVRIYLFSSLLFSLSLSGLEVCIVYTSV